MNMKLIPWWLLAAYIVIGSLISPTNGANLEWAESGYQSDDGWWSFTLLNVPSRDHSRYNVTMYQLLPSGDWEEIRSDTENCIAENTVGSLVPTTMDIPFWMSERDFKHHTKIVKVLVKYPDGEVLESNTVDLEQLHAINDNVLIAEIVGAIVGGVCFIAVVVGCILCKRKRQRLVPYQQPVAVAVPQTTPQVLYV